ncbi:MAG: RNA-binding S4 domain-containing protein [Azospirillaceae bacterium]
MTDEAGDGAGPLAGPGQRLDKWLWQARFFKTRGLAGRQCGEGRVRIDGAVVRKAHFAVRPGHVLTFVQGDHVRVIRVVALATRRGPASEARTLYDDLDPPSPETRLPRADAGQPPSPSRPPGAGKPNKRERRQLARLKGK